MDGAGAGSDRAEAWIEPALGGTLFLHADFRTRRFGPHFHEGFAIGIINEGCQAFTYDRGRRLDMPRGAIALIAPGIVHTGWVHTGWPGDNAGWRYRMLYPDADQVRQASEDVFGSALLPAFHRPVVSDRRVYDDLARLHVMSERGEPDPMAVETLYLAIVKAIFERHAGRLPPEAPGVSEAGTAAMRDAVEDRYAERVTLDELAAIAGVSRFTALRRFKAQYGLPPHAYLRQVRVNRALELVRAGHSLAETAAAVGFSDQAHMTRAFRRSLGYTPGVVGSAARTLQ